MRIDAAMKYLLWLAIAILTPRTLSQEMRPVLGMTVNCSAFNSSGCDLFNELMKAKDKQLWTDISPPRKALVCFRALTDTFMVISMFHGEFKPLLSDGKPLGDFKDAIGFVGFTEYHNGVASNERSFSGHWVTEKESEFGTFTSAGSRLDPLSGATVDDSQIAISISYENINGGKTAYSLTARFSTLRVAETFSVKQEDGKTWGDTSSGKCIYFHSY